MTGRLTPRYAAKHAQIYYAIFRRNRNNVIALVTDDFGNPLAFIGIFQVVRHFQQIGLLRFAQVAYFGNELVAESCHRLGSTNQSYSV